jgi:GxxExxY protein
MARITTHHSDESRPPGGLPWARLTRDIIGAFYDVYNDLEYGLLEQSYAAGLEIVLEERGFRVRREVALDVIFHGRRIGAYRADIIVDDKVVVEVKAGETLPIGSKAQTINYVRLSGLEVGLLLYFGPSPEFYRVVSSRPRNDRK